MDSCEHQRATLFVESFVQAMDGFDASGVHQRDAAHGQDQGMGFCQICKGFVELTGRRKEKRTREKRHADMFALPCGFDPSLFEAFNIHFLDININAGDLVEENRARQEGADENGLRQVEDNRCKHRDRESDHVGLEAFAEDKFDRVPFVHADSGDHQHARQRREWDPLHERREQEHGEQ